MARSKDGLHLLKRRLGRAALSELSSALCLLAPAGLLLLVTLFERRGEAWQWDDGVWLLMLLAAVALGLRMVWRFARLWPVERSKLYRAAARGDGIATAVVIPQRTFWGDIEVCFQDGEHFSLRLRLAHCNELLSVIARCCPGARIE